MLDDYKRWGDEDEYTEKYEEEILDQLDPYKVARALNGKVLLCYEKPGKFCHRHLVAEWLKRELNIDVREV